MAFFGVARRAPLANPRKVGEIEVRAPHAVERVPNEPPVEATPTSEAPSGQPRVGPDEPGGTAPDQQASGDDVGPSERAPEPNRVDVQVIANGFQVNGVLTTGRFERLSDWLNMQQGWIHVDEGVLTRPGEEEDAGTMRRSNQWVRLNEIVLVAERTPVKRDRVAAPGYVRKERRRVTVVTRGFTLRGYIHLIETGSMERFLDTVDPHFIPMTDLVVRWLADEGLVGHVPFALVNREQLISVAEEIPHPDADEAAASAKLELVDEPAELLRSA